MPLDGTAHTQRHTETEAETAAPVSRCCESSTRCQRSAVDTLTRTQRQLTHKHVAKHCSEARCNGSSQRSATQTWRAQRGDCCRSGLSSNLRAAQPGARLQLVITPAAAAAAAWTRMVAIAQRRVADPRTILPHLRHATSSQGQHRVDGRISASQRVHRAESDSRPVRKGVPRVD